MYLDYLTIIDCSSQFTFYYGQYIELITEKMHYQSSFEMVYVQYMYTFRKMLYALKEYSPGLKRLNIINGEDPCILQIKSSVIFAFDAYVCFNQFFSPVTLLPMYASVNFLASLFCTVLLLENWTN